MSAVLGPVLLAVGLCAGGAGPAPRTVEVFAAASLEAAFEELGREFAASRPGHRARFQFAGSSTLVQQVLRGASADVVAADDEDSLAPLVEAGEVAGTPACFARNRLADAGIVYATDVSGEDDRADAVPLPASAETTSRYLIGRLSRGANPEGAAAFLDLVLSPAGRAVLARHRFLAP